MVNLKSGYSRIRSSTLWNVLRTTSTVSVQGHSHAMSICELPTMRMLNCCSQGLSASSFDWACLSEASKPA